MRLIQSLSLYGCACLLAYPLSALHATGAVQVERTISDSEIIGIVMAVDQSEIAAANVAQTKQISHLSEKYANHIKTQHEKNIQQLNVISQKLNLSPVSSSISRSMVHDSEQGLKSLEALNGQAFESAYIDAMIKGHAGGLKLIKTNLLKNVTNTKLKHFLVSFKMMVAQHLKQALRIQKKLKATNPHV